MLPEIKVEPKPFTLSELRDLSDKDLSACLKRGHLDITVEGALCEWGGPLETVFRKLESSVMQWREEGQTKSILIQFIEADKVKPELPETEEGDIIRLDSP